MAESQEINPVHQEYMDLSSRYKAGWTFHRFLQGLRRFFGSQELHDHTAEFQELYSGLKQVSKTLNNPELGPVIDKLEELKGRLDQQLRHLDEEDRRVTPSLVRLFFQRVKTHDERILLDLIRFYLEVQQGRSWESQRFDKVDFLLSRLGEAIAGDNLTGDRSRLNRVLDGLASRLPKGEPPDPQKLENRRELIHGVRAEIEQLTSFESLTERDLVSHYRHVKHGLGNLLFSPTILPLVVDTNLLLTAQIRGLTQEEEKKILDDYEKVARLEEDGSVDDSEVAASVNRLHEQISNFRSQISAENIRLTDMAELRSSILDILGRMEVTGASLVEPTAEEVEPEAETRRLAPDRALPVQNERDLIGRSFGALVAALESSREGHATAEVPELSYRLEEREIEAFDRLAATEECDEQLEAFLLAAAALRARIDEEVTEIYAYRNRIGGKEPTVSGTTDRLLDLCDWYVRRFSHLQQTAGTPREAEEIHQLRLLQMRLMRDYSGLWLVAHGS